MTFYEKYLSFMEHLSDLYGTPGYNAIQFKKHWYGLL